MKFGDFLIDRGTLESSVIREALEVQRVSKAKKLGRLLVELGALTQAECNDELREFLCIKPVVNLLSKLQASEDRPKVEALTVENGIGYFVWETMPTLYVRNFNDQVVARAETLAREFLIKTITEEQEGILASMGLAEGKEYAQGSERNFEEAKCQIGRLVQTPYGDLFQSLLKTAKEMKVSDIHFDVTRCDLTVRFRVNGDLVEAKKIKLEHAQAFLTEVKRQVGLPLTVVGAPCGGAARFENLRVKVRAQSNGQINGEMIVLRLIDEDRVKDASIDRLGADELFVDRIKKALNSSNGLILVCGQTGSGKSWTLFSVLMSLDRSTQKVITIEDPVEYEGEGLMQIEIADGRIGFEEALKSCLRLDPDIIMIGEIRDEKSAQLAMKASSTGHLVLSTLHANGALDAIHRLRGLGIDDDLIRSNVRLVSALTLKKRLCAACKIEISEEEQEKTSEELRLLLNEGVHLFRRNEKGCEEPGCVAGAIGRTLLCESVDQEGVVQFLGGGFVPGYRSLYQCALEYAALGTIGVEDALYA